MDEEKKSIEKTEGWLDDPSIFKGDENKTSYARFDKRNRLIKSAVFDAPFVSDKTLNKVFEDDRVASDDSYDSSDFQEQVKKGQKQVSLEEELTSLKGDHGQLFAAGNRYDSFMAGMRRWNWIGNGLTRISHERIMSREGMDEGNYYFEPLKHIPERHLEEWEFYADADSVTEIEEKTRYLDQQIEDDINLRRPNSVIGTAAPFIAAAMDPLNLVAVGSIAKTAALAGNGVKLLARIGDTAIDAAFVSALAETSIYLTDPTAEAEQSVANFAGGMIGGTLLGSIFFGRRAGSHYQFSKGVEVPEISKIINKIDYDLTIPPPKRADPALSSQLEISPNRVSRDTGAPEGVDFDPIETRNKIAKSSLEQSENEKAKAFIDMVKTHLEKEVKEGSRDLTPNLEQFIEDLSGVNIEAAPLAEKQIRSESIRTVANDALKKAFIDRVKKKAAGEGATAQQVGAFEAWDRRQSFITPYHLINYEIKPTRFNQKSAFAQDMLDSGYLAESISKFSPLGRLVFSRSLFAKRLAYLIYNSPFYTKGNLRNIANPQSIESHIKLHDPVIGKQLDSLDSSYYTYRKIEAEDYTKFKESALRRRLEIARRQAVDVAGSVKRAMDGDTARLGKSPEGILTQIEFNEIVYDAVRFGDEYIQMHAEIPDAAKKLILLESKKVKEYFSLYQEKLSEFFDIDPKANYTPTHFNKEAILASRQHFTEKVSSVIKSKAGRSLTPLQANKEAEKLVSRILGENKGRIDYLPTASMSMQERKLNFLDFFGPEESPLINGYINRDIATVISNYHKSVVPDLELLNVFGPSILKSEKGLLTFEFKPFFKEIQAEYEFQIKNVQRSYPKKSGELEVDYTNRLNREKKKFKRRMDQDLADLEAGIDILRGTFDMGHGSERASLWSDRFTKFNVLGDAGGFVLSAVADVARPIMVNGAMETFGTALNYIKNPTFRSAMKELSKDASLVGPAFEMTLNLRSQLLADVFSSSANTKFDRILSGMTDKMFMLNLLGQWNQSMKTITSGVSSLRMMRAINDAYKNGKFKPKDREYMHYLGIDVDNATEMYKQWDKWNKTRLNDGLTDLGKGGGVFIPEAQNWGNQQIASMFMSALRKTIDDTIITPSVGTRPLTSHSPLGRILFQYKSFGFEAVNQIMVQGMQRRDAQFFTGLAMLVAVGGMVHTLKELKKGRDATEEPIQNFIWNSISASGGLGVLTDFEQAIQIGTKGKVGIPQTFGGDPDPMAKWSNFSRSIPTGSTIQDAFKVGGSALTLDWGPGATSAASRLQPYNNLFWLDWKIKNNRLGTKSKSDLRESEALNKQMKDTWTSGWFDSFNYNDPNDYNKLVEYGKSAFPNSYHFGMGENKK